MSDDDLTTAYMTGFHKRDDEVADLKAEIERLRGLLRESISPPPSPKPVLTPAIMEGFVLWAKDYERRVREALGE